MNQPLQEITEGSQISQIIPMINRQSHQEQQLQISYLQKSYSKFQFIKVITKLGQENPLFSSQKRQLEIIYQKVIESKGNFVGVDLYDLLEALKQRNRQRLQKQIEGYKKYIIKCRNSGKNFISSPDLLDYLQKSDILGHLSDNIYDLLQKQQQISIKKLEKLVLNVQQNLVDNQEIVIPKKVTLKKSQYYQHEELLQPLDMIIMTKSNKIEEIDVKKLRSIILNSIENQQAVEKIEKQFNILQSTLQQLTGSYIPQLKQQIQTLQKTKKALEQQLIRGFQQIDQKSAQNIRNKNLLLELTQKNKSLNKQLIQAKIKLNQKQQHNFQLDQINSQLTSKLQKQKQQTNKFINQFSNLQSQYEQYILSVKQNEDKINLQANKNLFPSISLKQQLQDAQFKIKKLKDQKQKLTNQLEQNQNLFVNKIQSLEKQLEEAKNHANKYQNLKNQNLAISKLSKNFQNTRFSKQSNFLKVPGKKSVMFDSVVSVFRQSTSKQAVRQSIRQGLKPQNKQGPKKMSMFLMEADQILYRPSIKKLQGRQSLQPVRNNQVLNSQVQYMNNIPRKDLQQQIDQLFGFQDTLQMKLYENDNEKQQQKYNFYDVNYNEIKKRLNNQNLRIISQDEFGQQNHTTIVSQQQIMNNNKDQNHQMMGERPKENQIEKNSNQKQKQKTMFICGTQIVSKSGNRFKKVIIFNRKGIFIFDTKFRLQKEIQYSKILKITFTYYNLDCFVISFRRKQSPMKKKSIKIQSDLIFRCLRTKQLIAFLSKPLFRQKILKENRITIKIQKQQDLWIRQSTEKDIVLSNCGNFYNPFKINLSFKNNTTNMFYAELSRQAFFSLSYIIICIVEQFGIYCFEWSQAELDKERKFMYLLPLVKRMVFIRQEEQSSIVKLIYEDWSDGKTFLLRFKNYRERLRFQTICKDRIKKNLEVLKKRKSYIENTFQRESYILDQ